MKDNGTEDGWSAQTYGIREDDNKLAKQGSIMKYKMVLLTLVAGLICLPLLSCGQDDISALRVKAEQGDARARFKYGEAYSTGESVPQDFEEAIKWWHLAAEQGQTDAQYKLGVCYDRGEGVPQDFKEAFKWYRVAAEKGKAEAQASLGILFGNGRGCSKDMIECYAWVNNAAAQGDKNGVFLRSTVQKMMTAEQIAEGQRLSREYARRFARFTDQSDGTVMDNATGLEWVKAPQSLPDNSQVINWHHATCFCSQLVYAGHSDWRLPDKDELEEQFRLKSPLFNMHDDDYWSGTSCVDTNRAQCVDMRGVVGVRHKSNARFNCYVWPTRVGQVSAVTDSPPKQTPVAARNVSNDGDPKAVYVSKPFLRGQASAVTEPPPKQAPAAARNVPTGGDPNAVSWEVVNKQWVKNIYANGDVTMSDCNSKNMWLYDANHAGRKTDWNSAVNYCKNLNYAGYSDWQLPEKEDLRDHCRQKEHFKDVQDYTYWSGTLDLNDKVSVWGVSLSEQKLGNAGSGLKSFQCHVWPVRSR